MSAVTAAVSALLLSSCAADDAPDADDGAPETTAEPAEEGTAAPGEDEEAEEEDGGAEPEPLSKEEMAEVLLTSGDLPETPSGHSTHTGLSWFIDELAVESNAYEEAFGESECAQALDTINVDLVGEGAEAGLAHEYRRPLSEDEEPEDAEDSPVETLVVWALAYPEGEESRTAPLWDELAEDCADGLDHHHEEVEIAPLEADEDFPFSGMSLTIRMEDEEGGTSQVEVYSATADVGPNTVMLSAVNMDQATFEDLLEVQSEKLEEHFAG